MLALLEYFWDDWPEGEPPPVVSATATVIVVASLGSKKSKEVEWTIDPAFERAPPEFWSVREAYLKRLKADVEKVVPHESILETVAHLDEGISSVQAAAETVAQRERAWRAAEAARTAEELNQFAEKILGLTNKLAEQIRQQKQDEEDLLLILMVI